jgi:hypothetical protein
MELRRLLGLLLVVAVAGVPLAACSSATKITATAGLDDSVNALAATGVAVVENVSSQAPIVAVTGTPSAMRFTRWQLQNLVSEANQHSGYLASELDGLATPPPGSPNLSVLIGAWLTRTDDPLARYAARFMTAPSDPKSGSSIVFPTLVVLTFIADIARMPATTSAVAVPRFDFERFIATPAEAQDGVCTDVSNFVSNVVKNVTSAIQANGTSWLATFWNTVVTVASTAIATVTSILTPLVGFITKIATICATIMQVTSMFKPWTVSLAGNPSAITLEDTPVSGAFNATLSAKDVQWPPELVSCIAAISTDHIDLSSASYKDAPVTWTQPVNIPGLATKLSEDDTLLDNKTAHYTFSTSTVPAIDPNDCPRLVNAGRLGITVTVARSDISKALTSLESLITGQIPASLRTYLQPYIDLATGSLNSAAGRFAAPHQSTIITLQQNVADPLCEHTPPPNGPSTPSPSPSATIAGTGSLPFAQCDQVLSAGDTAPYLSGTAVLDIPGSMAKNLTTISRAFAKIALQQSGGVSQTGYDPMQSSMCFIGIGTGDHPKLSAEFTVLPHDGTAYVNPDIDSGGVNPDSCRAVIGYALLDHFHADCFDVAGSLVKLDAPNVEYQLISQQALSGLGPDVIPVQAGQFDLVLKHLLERHQ